MRSLIAALPRESLFVCSQLPQGRWTDTEELLAQIVESESRIIRLLHIGLHFQAPHPDVRKLPRPGEQQDDPPEQQSKAEAMKAFFGGAVRYTKGR